MPKCDNVIDTSLIVAYDLDCSLINFSTNMFNFSSKFQGFRDKRKGKIWQLFHATDFESLMYPCFTFCRILGIFPYKINASTFKTSKPGYILSAFTICVLCVYNLINLYDINISKNIIYKSLPRILKRNCFFMLGGFIMIVTFILNGPRMHLLQTVLKISSRLPPESYQKLSRLIHIKDIFGFFFIVEQALIYWPKMHFNVFRKILILYIILLEFQINMLYINCVCVLKTCFKQINDKLSNLREIIMNDEPYLLRRIYSSQRNLFLLMELKALKKQHLAINDTVQMLKIIFSLHLLATTVMTFTQITFNLYIYLMRTRGDQLMSSFETRIYYKFIITSITYYFVKIGLIVWACESGKNQAMEISTTVYDVFNSTSDKQIKYELQLFSLQLLHCKNIFSAKGLTMDATLLTRMMGGITTYLLILVQFLFTVNSCNENFEISLPDII